jgi:hypothetical protein
MAVFDLFRRRPKPGGPEAVRARLEGAMAKRRLRGWNPPLENINALVASGGPRLLSRSRELVVTNGYAANACEAFAANLVGDGIKPSSLITNAALRDEVQKLWLAWTDEADADGLTDFYGLQAMIAREMFVAGECFVRLRVEKHLPREDFERINNMRRDFDRKLTSLLRDGVEKGAYTLNDPHVAALSIGGMVSWAYVWYRQNGRLTLDQVAEEMAVLIVAMAGAGSSRT